jgi:hypothetical protein
MSEVQDALETAADSGNDRINGFRIDAPASSSGARVAAVRRIILRFLENLPEDMMVVDIRGQLDD